MMARLAWSWLDEFFFGTPTSTDPHLYRSSDPLHLLAWMPDKLVLMDRTVPPKKCLRLQCCAQVAVTRYKKKKLSVMLLHTCSAHAVVWFVRVCARLMTSYFNFTSWSRKKIISRADLMLAIQATKFIDVPRSASQWSYNLPMSRTCTSTLYSECSEDRSYSYTMAKLQLYHWIPEAKVKSPVSVTFCTCHHSFVSKLNILLSVSKVFSESYVRCIIRTAHRHHLV